MPFRSAVMLESYACGMPIASTKTPRVGEGRTVASARGNDECAGYCPTMGAWSPVPVGAFAGIQRLLPESSPMKEMIDGLTFAAYRRIAAMIMVPAEGVRGSMEMLSIGSLEPANAQAADASAAND